MNVDGINLRDAGLQTGEAAKPNFRVGDLLHLTETPLRYTPDGQELQGTPEPCIAKVLDISSDKDDAGNLLLATVPAGSTFWAWPHELNAIVDAPPKVAVTPIASDNGPAVTTAGGTLQAMLDSAAKLRVRWHQACSDLQLHPERRTDLEALQRQARQDLDRIDDALKPLLAAEAERWRRDPAAHAHRCPEHDCILQHDDVVEGLYSGSIDTYRCPLAPGESCTGLWEVEHSADKQESVNIVRLPQPETPAT